jgi:hypothetical protein
VTALLKQGSRRPQAAGALNSRNEEVPNEVFIGAVEAGKIGLQINVNG